VNRTLTLCHETPGLAFPIQLLQAGPDDFTVIYGKQVRTGLTYARAASEYGEAIFHALACDGKLDNSKGEA
jgi:hypothetical protein